MSKEEKVLNDSQNLEEVSDDMLDEVAGGAGETNLDQNKQGGKISWVSVGGHAK